MWVLFHISGGALKNYFGKLFPFSGVARENKVME